MAKKKTRKKINKERQHAINRQRFLDRLPGSELEHKKLLLHFTERAIGPYNDPTMIAQAERIRNEIAELEKKGE